jgi:hypothetical protein
MTNTEAESSRGLSRELLNYLRQYPNQILDVEDIAAAVKRDADAVGGALSYLKTKFPDEVWRKRGGKVMYQPDGQTTGVMYGGKQSIGSRVEKYLVDHAGKACTLEEISSYLDVSKNQISTAINNAKNRHSWQIDNVMQGVYRYVPAAEPTTAPPLQAAFRGQSPIVSEIPPVEVEITAARLMAEEDAAHLNEVLNEALGVSEKPKKTWSRETKDPVKLAERDREVDAYIAGMDAEADAQVDDLPDGWGSPKTNVQVTVSKAEVHSRWNPDGKLFEQVGTTKAGNPLVRDEDGALFTLEEL